MDGEMQKLAIELSEVDSRSRSNTHRLNRIEAQVDMFMKLTTSVEKIAQSVLYIQKDMTDVKQDVKDLDGKMSSMQDEITEVKNTPAKETKKKVDNIKDKLIWLIVGGIAAFIFFEATGIAL